MALLFPLSECLKDHYRHVQSIYGPNCTMPWGQSFLGRTTYDDVRPCSIEEAIREYQYVVMQTMNDVVIVKDNDICKREDMETSCWGDIRIMEI